MAYEAGPGGAGVPAGAGGAGDRAAARSGAPTRGVAPAARLAEQLRDLVDAFDPEVVLARDARDLVGVFSTIEHLASTGVALAARRVAGTNLWEGQGHRTPAHWLAARTGMAVGDAMRLLEVAEAAEQAPMTLEAMKAGELSTRQARHTAEAEKVDPTAAQEMIEQARDEQVTVREMQERTARIVDAASTETDAEKAERIHAARFLHTGTNPDGTGWGSWCLPIAMHARLLAALDGAVAHELIDAREQGRRESHDHLAADALCRLADAAVRRGRRSAGETGAAGSSAGPGTPEPGLGATKVIIRVDLTALDRGELGPGEVCEVAGMGPVPVAEAWRSIDGGAFVAAVTTRGVEIDKVVHLGRRPTVLQRTALEWETAGTCVVRGCHNTARVEIDHVADWADTRVTRLPDLAAPCGFHHDLKTHQGYRFGPREADGKRRLVPPDGVGNGADEPDGGGRWRPPPSRSGAHPPPRAWRRPPPVPGHQGDLFDTG